MAINEFARSNLAALLTQRNGHRPKVAMADERLSVDGMERLRGLLAAAWVAEITRDFTDESMPLDVSRLGRTIGKWADQIVAWHRAHLSNGPTEAINNLVKRVKRTAFGFSRFGHYRIRALLYAGRPNWSLLNTLTPP